MRARSRPFAFAFARCVEGECARVIVCATRCARARTRARESERERENARARERQRDGDVDRIGKERRVITEAEIDGPRCGLCSVGTLEWPKR